MATDQHALWLLGRDRRPVACITEFNALVVHERFGDHSTFEGVFPADDRDKFSAATFAQLDASGEVYVVEQTELVTDQMRRHLVAKGRSATAMLHTRVLDGEHRYSGTVAGAVVEDMLSSLIASDAPDRRPVYRYYSKTAQDHMLTTNPSEMESATGYAYEGVAWEYVEADNAIPVYRFQNAVTGRHLFTTNQGEVTSPWALEGAAFYSAASGTAVYRLSHPTGDHLWTTSATEISAAVSAGWTNEGLAFYIATIDDAGYDRTIEGLAFGEGVTAGEAIDMQRSWGDLGDAVLEVLGAGTLGIRSRLVGRSILIDVFEPATTAVTMGEAYGDGLASSLSVDKRAWRNYAYVLGEGEGSARVQVEVDLTDGEERRELYVDARDLQKEVDGETLSDADYEAVLTQRGTEKLAETRLVEFIEATATGTVSVGDLVHYDSGEWSAELMASEVTTTIEGGASARKVLLGEPPATLKRTVKRSV